MDALELTPDAYARWDAVAADSDEAWFWQTTRWIDWICARAGDDLIANRSFFIAQGPEIVAIAPLVVERGPEGPRFAFTAGPLAAPAIRRAVGPAGRREIREFYARTLAERARKDDVTYACIRVPALSAGCVASPAPYVNPFLRVGFFDLPYLTQIIDLQPDEAALWSAIRKGHKADIKTARRRFDAAVWYRDDLPAGRFGDYQALHARDAGRVTRSQKTFDMMEAWVRDGHAALVEVSDAGRPVAFALLILYQDGGMYASACKDPDIGNLPASHLVQWTAITWLKAHGYRWYDVGLQQFGPQWFEVPSEKELTIARFKRGFGGRTLPLPTAEVFFAAEAMERVFARRIRAYTGALASPVGVES